MCLFLFFFFSYFFFPHFSLLPFVVVCGLGWAVPVWENLDTWKVGGRENELVSKG